MRVTGLCHASKHRAFCPFRDLMTPGMSGMRFPIRVATLQ